MMLVRMTETVLAMTVIVLLTGVFGIEQWGVTYTQERLCALKGSSVQLSCTYKHPKGLTVTKTVWFNKDQTDAEPVDLREDMKYQGRVQYKQSSKEDSSLIIHDLRESDSQTYRFRFHTDGTGGKYTGQPGVTLSVIDLKITVEIYSSGKYLTCSNTCFQLTHIWYKNGQPISNSKRYHWLNKDRSVNAGSYSCAIEGYEDLRSPALCVFDKNKCWSITYSTKSICALIGSTVDIDSYYTFPDQTPVPQPAWYIRLSSKDKELSPEVDRMEFFSDRANVSTLRLKNLTQSDSAQYLLQFKPPYNYYIQRSSAISLHVTGMEVKVYDYADGQIVKLICSTTCYLPNKPTYIWYKNGQSLYRFKSASCNMAVVNEAVSYSCAVEGYESFPSPPVYSPRKTMAVMVPSEERVEGDSVTLICRSDARPPVVSYSWFKQREATDTQLARVQNYTITSISSQHSGLYYCTAHSQLGEDNSTTIHLDVLYPPRNTRALQVPSGEIVEGDLVTLKCSSDANPPDLFYSWFKKSSAKDTLMSTSQNYGITNISSQHSSLYHCTAQNRLGQHNSTPIHLDVLYPPRNLTLSYIATGDSVTLMCASDSNPVSSYTWFKKTGNDIKTVGNNTNLTVEAGGRGLFYCMAKNQHGSFNSSEWQFTSDTTSAQYAAFTVPVVFLLILIAVILWLRRKAADATSMSEVASEKDASTTVYGNVSAMTSELTRPAASDDEDDVLYTSVHFTRLNVQEVHLYSTVQQPGALKQEDEVEYTTVNFVKQRPVRKNEDPIYSVVQKT